MSGRTLSLTNDLVALAHREVADSGPFREYDYFSDDDYAIELERILTERPVGPFWVFAYGSLIWRAEFAVARESTGIAYGWHRSFCMRMIRWRATKEQPGLMLALDEGGECKGVLLQIPETDLRDALLKLLRREMTSKPPSNLAKWIEVSTIDGPVNALAFVMNTAGDDYVGQLPLQDVARDISKACGHLGSNAEYLLNTVVHLEERGLHDPMLWQLQMLVAEQLKVRRPQ